MISVNAIAYCLIGLAVAYPLIGPYGWRITCHLLASRRVVVREYRTADLAPDAVLTEVALPRDAILRLAFLFALPRGLPIYNKCLFAPHHEIEITDAHGELRKIIICFGCDLVAIRTSSEVHAGPLYDLGSRAKVLKRWMRKQGIPVRPDLYVWSQSLTGS